jgi:ATP-binding protein involved in chromosome partitioning
MSLPIFRDQPNRPLSGVKAVIAIAAGKGGVGKSSVTVNLALALTACGYKVGILDADIYGPSIRKMLPEDHPPSQKGELIQPAVSAGIKNISMAFFRKENEAAAVRAPIANGLINQFIKNVNWGELDYLLIDFPPGTGDIQLTLCQQLPLSGAIMVTTPQEVALLDVRKAAALFDIVKVPLLGIIENMSYYKADSGSTPVYIFGKGGGARLASELAVPFFGEIPLDPELCASGDSGESLFLKNQGSQSPTIQAFFKCAQEIAERLKKLSSSSSIGIKKLWQKDPLFFSIEWGDGSEQDFRLSDVQKECPCANCVDENTGQRISDPLSVNPEVKAISIRNVGRYGIQIQFSSGCSTGIYLYDYLRGLKKR